MSHTLVIEGHKRSPQQAYKLGEKHLLAGNNAAAGTIFLQILAHQPAFAPALVGMGHIQERSGNLLQALDYAHQAHAANAHYTDVYELFSYLCHKLHKFEACIRWSEEGLKHTPKSQTLLLNLSHAFYSLQRYPEALSAYRKLLAVNPKHPEAQHMSKALGGEHTEKANAAYIKEYFDNFTTFDDHLVNKLGYRTPQEIVALIAQASGQQSAAWNIVDLGCGTGLCGPLLKPYIKSLVGVDLSPGMLKQAEGRNYTQLVCEDLVSYLEKHPAAFNLVLSSDTLIYIGNLEDTFRTTAQALLPGGLFAFSTEDNTENTGFFLKPSGRYGHHQQYIQGLATKYGFQVVQHTTTQIRMELNKPITGQLFALQRSA